MKKALMICLLLATTNACSKVEAPTPASPEQMMEKIAQASTPGDEHKRLEPLVGNWKTTTTF